MNLYGNGKFVGGFFHTKCVGSWSFFEERKETHGKILYVLWHGIGGG